MRVNVTVSQCQAPLLPNIKLMRVSESMMFGMSLILSDDDETDIKLVFNLFNVLFISLSYYTEGKDTD